eukprot:CAMPEP_0176378506 /NCGR_PEP_ID=MMETSP0126-20121128/29669_1 /TAXON_ID=141414 ORGANISM="Strombidinopsis acuminatum, Strain SPMC142" /NCGR_SAMPLE_ID=MMETSP0126 /ASSEMBLY_ACC=CAM_ASM_000229 /LENGTH=45 /DNA_ID= /DNA_START= /DNA_END= /DNA_ORIENTATION=
MTAQVIDSPGSLIRTRIGIDYFFHKVDAVFIVLDTSLTIDADKIN